MSLNLAFVDALRRATLKWRSRSDAALKRCGQTHVRTQVLLLLSQETGGMMQRDLAAGLSIEHPTLVRILDGLERQRLITRAPVPEDKRANRIALTPAAGPVVTQANRVYENLRNRILCSIPPEDLATAAQVLSAVAGNLDRLAATEAAPRQPAVREDGA